MSTMVQLAKVTEVFPKRFSFEVTNRCNLKCVMCPHGIGAIESPHDADLKLLDALWPGMAQAEELHLNGVGEPLLAGIFWTVITRLKGKERPRIRFNTNGLLLTQPNVERLAQASLAFISISLDAATPGTYKDIRGGQFEKAIDGVKRLVDKVGETTQIKLSMVLMKRNIHEVEPFVELAARLGVPTVFFQHLTDTAVSSESWRVERPSGWTFVYNEQRLAQDPELSNFHVKRAMAAAKRLGVDLAGWDLLFETDKGN